MIRQPLLRSRATRSITVWIAAGALSGCVSIQTGGGTVTYWVVPGLESGHRSNSAGTTYYNERWSRSPDTHPAVSGSPRVNGAPAGAGESQDNASGSHSAVYPPYSTRGSTAARGDGQMAGGVVGALIGTQVGGGPGGRSAGVLLGSAVGALAGGKLADPCQPDANAGSFWGALAGGWLGSLFGGGRTRDLFIALGAAGGAVRGTEMWGEGGGHRGGCR